MNTFTRIALAHVGEGAMSPTAGIDPTAYPRETYEFAPLCMLRFRECVAMFASGPGEAAASAAFGTFARAVYAESSYDIDEHTKYSMKVSGEDFVGELKKRFNSINRKPTSKYQLVCVSPRGGQAGRQTEAARCWHTRCASRCSQW